jgi:Flp pilus assembly protein TadG
MEPSTAFWRTLPARRSLLTLLGRVWKSDNRGSALVEMAVVLPLMLVLITGMMSMGIVLNNYLVLAHASDIGARYLALNQGQFTNTATGNPCAMAAQQIQAAAVAIPASSISYGFGITTPPPSPTTTWYGGPGTGSGGFSGTTGASCGATGSTNLQSGGTVTVSVQYPVVPMVMFWAHHTINLTATTTEIVQ